MDQPSIKFGWETFDFDIYIPFLFRAEEKMFSLTIVEEKLFKELKKKLPPEVPLFYQVIFQQNLHKFLFISKSLILLLLMLAGKSKYSDTLLKLPVLN
jgi:hypothetical protein